MVVVLAAAFAVIEGCSTQSGGNPAQSGGSSWSPVCPDSLQAFLASCTNPVAEPPCEYGNAWWDAECDIIVQCGTGGNMSEVSRETCFPQPGPNSVDCPRDPSSGAACAESGLTCYYGESAACECLPGPGADAGLRWQCNPDPGCPTPRPRFGAACSVEQTCAYGVAPNLLCEQCLTGYWQEVYDPCPSGAPTPEPPLTGCPHDPATIRVGTACAMPGLTCSYGDATCDCLPTASADAGAIWGCNPEPGCPNPRPAVGASCIISQACDYGSDSNLLCEACVNGSWQEMNGSCFSGGP